MALDRELKLEMTKEELQIWLNYDSTKKVLRFLDLIRDHYKEQLTEGLTLNLSSPEATGMQTTLILGKISGLNSILELSLSND